MAKYQVTVTWSGYSRGIAIYLVEADNEDDARENYWSGEKTYNDVIRDDTEREVEGVELTTE